MGNNVKVVMADRTGESYVIVDHNDIEIGTLNHNDIMVDKAWRLKLADYEIGFDSLSKATQYTLAVFGASQDDYALEVLAVLFSYPDLDDLTRNLTAQVKISGMTQPLLNKVIDLAVDVIYEHYMTPPTLCLSEIKYLEFFISEFS